MRTPLALIVALAVAVGLLAPSALGAGSVSYQGCWDDTAAQGCPVANADLSSLRQIVVGPDGTEVYVAGTSGVYQFSRDATTGALNFSTCYENPAQAPFTGCQALPHGSLSSAYGLALSPDGKSLYATAFTSDAITTFSRDTTTGALTFVQCLADSTAAGCTAADGTKAVLDGAEGVAVSADGESVYVAAHTGGALTEFDRNTSTGALTFSGCFADNLAGPLSGTCDETSDTALSNPSDVVMDAGGTSLYVSGESAVSHFSRAANTTGLTFQDCVGDLNANGCVVPPKSALAGAFGLALSPDGHSLYVTGNGDNSVSTFARDTTTGGLTFGGCLAESGGSSCDNPGQPALKSPIGVAVSPDGQSVVVGAQLDDAMAILARDTGTGALSFDGCFANSGSSCSAPAHDSLEGPNYPVFSPDGSSIYLTGIGALSSFTRVAAGGGAPGGSTVPLPGGGAPAPNAGASAAQQVLACSKRPLVLEDVVPRGGHVDLLGFADRRFVGKRVAIVFAATGRVVAHARVRSDGSFTAKAKLPPARIRHSNRARYQARIGHERSLNLKLFRRMVVTSARSAHGKVTIVGRVLPPLAPKAKDRVVTLQRLVTCSRAQDIARVTPRRNGSFQVTVAAPPGQIAAVYRLRTKIRAGAKSKRLGRTYTLPRAIDFK